MKKLALFMVLLSLSMITFSGCGGETTETTPETGTEATGGDGTETTDDGSGTTDEGTTDEGTTDEGTE